MGFILLSKLLLSHQTSLDEKKNCVCIFVPQNCVCPVLFVIGSMRSMKKKKSKQETFFCRFKIMTVITQSDSEICFHFYGVFSNRGLRLTHLQMTIVSHKIM